ncbi:hypothetical protein ACGFS9_23370 [Streptomyces sp. NPDC048566]|uniref:hypothetical protein n=1 Tax=Streptomyces sp. NPDC048566 TaxID=3365569 RepID=UPI0037112DE8
MSARTHTRIHPATSGRGDTRLPWWALALPTLAFVALLLLIVNPADAHATAGDPAVTHLFHHIRTVLHTAP